MCDLGNREISEFVSHPLVAEIPNVSRFKAHGAGGEGAGIRVSKGEALSGRAIILQGISGRIWVEFPRGFLLTEFTRASTPRVGHHINPVNLHRFH
jgi:hypothetical protein